MEIPNIPVIYLPYDVSDVQQVGNSVARVVDFFVNNIAGHTVNNKISTNTVCGQTQRGKV